MLQKHISIQTTVLVINISTQRNSQQSSYIHIHTRECSLDMKQGITKGQLMITIVNSSQKLPLDPSPHSRPPTGNVSSAVHPNYVVLSPTDSPVPGREPASPSQTALPGAASAWRSPSCLHRTVHISSVQF